MDKKNEDTPTMGEGMQPEAIAHFIPSEHWRDGLCDCFKFGICHAMCCLGCWCLPVLSGQVMTRMGRNFIGAPGAHPSVSNTCMIVTTIWIIFWLIDAVLQIVLDVEGCWGGTVRTNEDGTTEIECLDGTFKEISSTYNTISIIAGVLGFIFFCYMLVAVCQTRYATRQKFNIPPGCCGGCEDFCCVLWCSCCAVEQMARHTNDYDTYNVTCCSSECFNKRGQQEIVPYIV